MQQKKLEDLNLLDDFLFNAVISYPDFGEIFGRKLLKILFNREIENLKVIPQRYYGGGNPELRGARLDVYLEEKDVVELESAYPSTIYDIEPDQNKKDVEKLPKRVRFYHALIDERSLKAGQHFEKLKNVIVIFISSYDPFQRDRIWYTMKTTCLEEPEMPYDDGAWTIFLYTRGTRGKVSKQVRELLNYFEKTTQENAANESLKEIQEIVDRVKLDGEVSIEYMKWFEREQRSFEAGRQEGREEGIRAVEAERENTERERKIAEQERKRAETAEAEKNKIEQRANSEIARLKAELARLQAVK